MRNLRILLGMTLMVFVVGAVLLLKNGAPSFTRPQGIFVVATTYPVGYFAQVIAGGDATVRLVTPLGVEPHDHEPPGGDLAMVEDSDLFLYVGGEFDPWAQQAAQGLAGQKPLVRSIINDRGEGLVPQDNLITDTYGAPDPHAWLDPLLSKDMAHGIADALAEIDPVHASSYRVREIALVAQLDALHARYIAALASCSLHVIVVSHDAYEYLGRRYELQILPIAGLSPDMEPSPGVMADIARTAQAQGVHTIFFESMVNPNIAETLAREIGAEARPLDPLENILLAEVQAGATYFSIAERNLIQLTNALSCTTTS